MPSWIYSHRNFQRWSTLENLATIRWVGLLLTGVVTALALLITLTHIWVHRRARFSIYTNFTTVTMSVSGLVILIAQVGVVMPALVLSMDGFYEYQMHPLFKAASTLSDAAFAFATYFTFVLVVRRVFIAVKNRRLRRTHRMMMLFTTVMFSLGVLACAAWAECFLRFDQEGIFFYRVLREVNYTGWLLKVMLDLQAPFLFTLDILLLLLRRMCRARKKTAQLLGEGSAATVTAGNRGADDAAGANVETGNSVADQPNSSESERRSNAAAFLTQAHSLSINALYLAFALCRLVPPILATWTPIEGELRAIVGILFNTLATCILALLPICHFRANATLNDVLRYDIASGVKLVKSVVKFCLKCGRK